MRPLIPNTFFILDGCGDVETLGAGIEDIRVPGFRVPGTVRGGTGFGSMAWVAPVFRRGFNKSPRVVEEKCASCGVCMRACPVGAISMEDCAFIDNRMCIRYYCCHEMCPENAIKLGEGTLYRFFKGQKVRAR